MTLKICKQQRFFQSGVPEKIWRSFLPNNNIYALLQFEYRP